MAADVATSRHYVEHCISDLATVLTCPDINRPFPEGSNPAAGLFRIFAPASGCPLASRPSFPCPSSVVSSFRLAASFGAFHQIVAGEISSVAVRAFPWPQMEIVMIL